MGEGGWMVWLGVCGRLSGWQDVCVWLDMGE